jgi:hypothetical protein
MDIMAARIRPRLGLVAFAAGCVALVLLSASHVSAAVLGGF